MSQGTDGSMATLHSSSSKGRSPSWPPMRCRLPNASRSRRQPSRGQRRPLRHPPGQDGDRRFISSVREVVDAEGQMVVSNEVFRPGPDGRAVPGVPLRSDTLDQLAAVGFDPGLLDRPQAGGAVTALAALCGTIVGLGLVIIVAASRSRAASPRRVRRAPAGRTGHAPARTGGRCRRASRGGHALARGASGRAWPGGAHRGCSLAQGTRRSGRADRGRGRVVRDAP